MLQMLEMSDTEDNTMGPAALCNVNVILKLQPIGTAVLSKQDLDLEHSRQTPNVGYHVDVFGRQLNSSRVSSESSRLRRGPATVNDRSPRLVRRTGPRYIFCEGGTWPTWLTPQRPFHAPISPHLTTAKSESHCVKIGRCTRPSC